MKRRWSKEPQCLPEECRKEEYCLREECAKEECHLRMEREKEAKCLRDACIGYFRSSSVFARLLKGFREKYISYGNFAGTVTLRKLTDAETEELEGFFQKNFHGQKSVTISAKRFENALQKSRFESVSPKEILEDYFDEELTGKKTLEIQRREECSRVFMEMIRECGREPAVERVAEEQEYRKISATEWITEIQENGKESTTEQNRAMQESKKELTMKWIKEMQDSKKDSAGYIWKQYRESGQNPETLRRALRLGVKIFHSFPGTETPEYLPVFAAKVTGNPHSFDDGTAEGRFLYQLVEWLLNQQNIFIKKSDIFPAIQKQKQYLAVGILRDDISNYAMISGIHVRKKNGELHAGIEGFWREKEMMQVPLAVIAEWGEIECPDHVIYIVENPSVYAMLSQRTEENCAIMCMNGQPRLSSVLILDLLIKSNVKVYYAGDFDPEGLLIAQKIRQYYGGPFSYWHMSRADYEKSMSKETISARRKKILRRITDEELRKTANAIEKTERAGYQENIWREYYPADY